MKVMTFNIKHNVLDDFLFLFRKKRYKEIVKYLKKENPDILGLQELTFIGKMYLRLKLKEYNIIGNSRHSKLLTNEYNCLLIKKKYKVLSYNTYSLSNNINKLGTKYKNDKFPRICVIAHINVGKKRFMVSNTHIDNSDYNNKKRMLAIYEKILKLNLKKGEYVILLGDYNMTIQNDNLLKFSKKYNDPFKDYSIGTFPSFPDLKSIDHIFLDKRLDYYNDRINIDSNDRLYLSDHFPKSCCIKTKK